MAQNEWRSRSGSAATALPGDGLMAADAVSILAS